MKRIMIGWLCDHSDEPLGESTHEYVSWESRDWVTNLIETRERLAYYRTHAGKAELTKAGYFKLNFHDETGFKTFPYRYKAPSDHDAWFTPPGKFGPICPRTIELFTPELTVACHTGIE